MTTDTKVCNYCGMLDKVHERCPDCGYSWCDCAVHGDHSRCPQPDPVSPDLAHLQSRDADTAPLELIQAVKCSECERLKKILVERQDEWPHTSAGPVDIAQFLLHQKDKERDDVNRENKRLWKEFKRLEGPAADAMELLHQCSGEMWPSGDHDDTELPDAIRHLITSVREHADPDYFATGILKAKVAMIVGCVLGSLITSLVWVLVG